MELVARTKAETYAILTHVGQMSHSNQKGSVQKIGEGWTITVDVTHSYDRVTEVNRRPCDPAHDAGYDDCVYAAAAAAIAAAGLGCTSPFVPRRLRGGAPVCGDRGDAAAARDAYFAVYYNASSMACAEPCTSARVKSPSSYLYVP